MGVKLAGELAYHGHRVKIFDSNVQTLNKVRNILEDDKKQLYREGLLPQKNFVGQVFCLSRLEETVKDAEIILECVIEDLEVKQDLFERISHCCKENAVIATNTLRLDINKINQRVLINKDRTLGLRFLFPVYCIPEVEITPGTDTSKEVIERVRTILERMGKTLFFRSGLQPLVLSETQRSERKKARMDELFQSSGIESFRDMMVPGLQHKGNVNTKRVQDEAATVIPSDLDRDCAICMDRLRDCLFRPCNHMVVCLECGDMLMTREDACPVCRKDIDETIRVFHN